MKTNSLLLFAMFLLLLSCTSESKTNKTNSSFESLNSKTYDLEIDILESDTNYFEEDILINLSSSEFIVDNFAGVVGYQIDDLQFDINDYEGNELIQCDFELAFVHLDEIIGSSISYSVPLYTYSQQGSFINVNHSSTTRNLVENYMNSEKKATLRVSGIVSGTPAKFNSTFKISVKISSN